MYSSDLMHYILSGLMVMSAFFILLTQHMLYTALALIATLLGLAALYALTGAEFIAVTQLIVYIGGILVLILFAIMLTNQGKTYTARVHTKLICILLIGGLFSLLLWPLVGIQFESLNWMNGALQTKSPYSAHSIESLGIQLLSRYVLVFELAAIVLLVALVGAVYIARADYRKP